MSIQRRIGGVIRALWPAILLTAGTMYAQNDLCIPGIGGLGGVPAIDGDVENDPGWNNALRLNLSGDIGATTASKLQLGISGTSLYLGLDVSAPGITTDTTLVLVFSGDGNPANDWRLHIRPFDVALPADGTKNLPPFAVTYWRDSTVVNNQSNWNLPGAIAHTAGGGDWEMTNIKILKVNNNSWQLEFQIPIVSPASSTAGFCVSCGGGTFKIYANVLNTSSGVVPNSSVTEDVWPPCPMLGCAMVIGSGFLTQNTPPRLAWGTGSTSMRAACTGVSLSGPNIGVQNPLNASQIISNIRRYTPIAETTAAGCKMLTGGSNPGDNGPPNIFVAKPVNGMTTNAKVSVSFRLANWGIAGSTPGDPFGSTFSYLGTLGPSAMAPCTPVGSPNCPGVNNNPAAEATITPGASGNFNTTTWALNYQQSCYYSLSVPSVIGEPLSHQCIHVDMDSSDPGTRFLNKSAEWNMNFVPASTFRQKGIISGNQGPLPPGRSKHMFLLQMDSDQQGPPRTGGTTGTTGTTGTQDARTNGGGQQQGYRFRDQQLAAAATRFFGEKTNNLYQWIARGYIYTGNKIIINGRSYEYVRRAGDFGYVAGHSGAIKGWNPEFHGTGLNQINPALYSGEVATNEQVVVETVITAQEQGTPGRGMCSPAGGKAAIFLPVGMLLAGLLIYRPRGKRRDTEGE
jgi:hypothetical protein